MIMAEELKLGMGNARKMPEVQMINMTDGIYTLRIF